MARRNLDSAQLHRQIAPATAGPAFKFLALLMLFVPTLFFGCTGDDGADGKNGEPGLSTLTLVTDEPEGENCSNGGQKIQTGVDLNRNGILDPDEVTSTSYVCNGGGVTPTASPESCAVCHSSVESIHAATGNAVVGPVAAVLTPGGRLVFTFNVKVDGVNSDVFTLRRAYVNYDDPNNPELDPAVDYITTFVRTQIATEPSATVTTPARLVANGSGNYTLTVPADSGNPVPGDSVPYVIDNSNYLFQLTNAAGDIRPVVLYQYGAAHLRDLVTNDSCASCHGPYPAWSEKFSHYAVGGSECQICHSQWSRSAGFISKDETGAFVEAGPFPGTNIVEYIHGIHNSHNMPDGVYYRTTAPDDSFTDEDRYSIGYPSDMRNCSVCHTEDRLAAVAAAPVSYHLCMSCHNNWDGFVDHDTGEPILGPDNFHRNLIDIYTDCMDCHGDSFSLDEVSDFHNSFDSEDSHYDSFYRGTDISLDNPNDVSFAISLVTRSGDNVSFTWTASKNGAAVDPCNADINNGPVFSGLGAYLAYGKGDDWVNENVSSSPGQPAGAANLFTSLATSCEANVATTTGLTIAPGTVYAKKVLLAIGGKPVDQDTFTIGRTPRSIAFFVRVPSPTYAFSMADGSAMEPRRDAVNTGKCLQCHRGTLYQHGGDRVDNEQLCVICHNPSASDMNNRKERYQIVNADGTVNTEATYDGKTNETYDMRYMLHSIHGIGMRGFPWVVYRSRGIFAFATADAELPTGWPEDGETIYGSTNGSKIAHSWTVVHYPKPASECSACHNEGAYEAPDQTKAVALTVDPGASYPVQSDDTVIGPTAGACTACHATAPVRTHAIQFGYKAQVTKDEMLELAGP